MTPSRAAASLLIFFLMLGPNSSVLAAHPSFRDADGNWHYAGNHEPTVISLAQIEENEKKAELRQRREELASGIQTALRDAKTDPVYQALRADYVRVTRPAYLRAVRQEARKTAGAVHIQAAEVRQLAKDHPEAAADFRNEEGQTLAEILSGAALLLARFVTQATAHARREASFLRKEIRKQRAYMGGLNLLRSQAGVSGLSEEALGTLEEKFAALDAPDLTTLEEQPVPNPWEEKLRGLEADLNSFEEYVETHSARAARLREVNEKIAETEEQIERLQLSLERAEARFEEESENLEAEVQEKLAALDEIMEILEGADAESLPEEVLNDLEAFLASDLGFRDNVDEATKAMTDYFRFFVYEVEMGLNQRQSYLRKLQEHRDKVEAGEETGPLPELVEVMMDAPNEPQSPLDLIDARIADGNDLVARLDEETTQISLSARERELLQNLELLRFDEKASDLVGPDVELHFSENGGKPWDTVKIEYFDYVDNPCANWPNGPDWPSCTMPARIHTRTLTVNFVQMGRMAMTHTLDLGTLTEGASISLNSGDTLVIKRSGQRHEILRVTEIHPVLSARELELLHGLNLIKFNEDNSNLADLFGSQLWLQFSVHGNVGDTVKINFGNCPSCIYSQPACMMPCSGNTLTVNFVPRGTHSVRQVVDLDGGDQTVSVNSMDSLTIKFKKPNHEIHNVEETRDSQQPTLSARELELLRGLNLIKFNEEDSDLVVPDVELHFSESGNAGDSIKITYLYDICGAEAGCLAPILRNNTLTLNFVEMGAPAAERTVALGTGHETISLNSGDTLVIKLKKPKHGIQDIQEIRQEGTSPRPLLAVSPLALVSNETYHPFPTNLMDAGSTQKLTFRFPWIWNEPSAATEGVLVLSQDPNAVPLVLYGQKVEDVPACKNREFAYCLNIKISRPSVTPPIPVEPPAVYQAFSSNANQTYEMRPGDVLIVYLSFGGFTPDLRSQNRFAYGGNSEDTPLDLSQMIETHLRPQAALNRARENFFRSIIPEPTDFTLAPAHQWDISHFAGLRAADGGDSVAAIWQIGLNKPGNSSPQLAEWKSDAEYRVTVYKDGTMKIRRWNTEKSPPTFDLISNDPVPPLPA